MEPLDERLLESKIFTLGYCITYRWFTHYPLQWRDPVVTILTKLSNWTSLIMQQLCTFWCDRIWNTQYHLWIIPAKMMIMNLIKPRDYDLEVWRSRDKLNYTKRNWKDRFTVWNLLLDTDLWQRLSPWPDLTQPLLNPLLTRPPPWSLHCLGPAQPSLSKEPDKSTFHSWYLIKFLISYP